MWLMIITIIWLFIGLLLLATLIILWKIFFSLLTMSLFHGAYFAASSAERIESIIKLANVYPGQKVVDLGSGDGRVVIALAKAGANAVGIEVNPWLALKSRWAIKGKKLSNKAKILTQNLWNHDLSKYDVVVVYGIGYIMPKLEEKFKSELKAGAKVISVYFKLPDRKPVKSSNEVYLYRF